MMAAITAAGQGKRVLVLEKMDRLGKKLLATGNGKCNYTNRYQAQECYRSREPEFAWKGIQAFGAQQALDFFHQLGILPRERAGYYYPASGQAASVREALERRLEGLGVEIHTGERVTGLYPGEKGWLIESDHGKYGAEKVILSVGGQAAPVHGSSGDGYDMAQSLGHEIVPVLPALTSCILKGDFMKKWGGVRIQGKITLYSKAGEQLAQDRGELQLVDYGISGIPVFQVSRYAAVALHQGDQPYLIMDIMEDYSLRELTQELEQRREALGQYQGVQALDGMLHSKLAAVLLKEAGLSAKQNAGSWSDRQLAKLAQRMKQWKLGIAAVSGFDKAQVTCGGVSTKEVDGKTMESRLCPGLYLTGELLDVDGICGGYNLQWAWTSGYLAGLHAGR